ncbi:hypothetical protein KVR01_004597 [Diaporthe batatas]|uniref:uncharacterized protein n=1 Tax=Diaporthe batatas TaxID=748121 RepID=UPI001D051438|nr:uncharacterized protein KVR01_004597 [Diaporthe batatas]KAG8166045.1 hypothetical protein KVR01_004597 [Diaporthe batatas]
MATTTTNPKDRAAEITKPIDFDPAAVQRISRRPDPAQQPEIHEPDPRWPSAFARLEARIRGALGGTALAINHVGSTSVPGLPAKPCIDVDVTVADPADEAAYVSALVGEGWEGQKEDDGTGTGMGPAGGDRGAGLQFLLREPGWHQHRLFICADPVANVHVFGPGCPESERHRIFRDWLREHPEDRDRYAAVKYEAAAASREAGETMQDYTERKNTVIRDILDRAFRAEGLLQ